MNDSNTKIVVSKLKIGQIEISLWDQEVSYNNAAKNERMVEVPLAEWFLKKHSNLIEIGAVTPYYFSITHDVFDIKDPYSKCIRERAENLNYKNKILLSISTIEHVGRGDYDEPAIDGLSLQTLLKMLEATIYLITWPRSYTRDIDAFAEYNNSIIKLKRVDDRKWERVNSLENVYYNSPYSYGNGLYIATNCEDLT